MLILNGIYWLGHFHFAQVVSAFLYPLKVIILAIKVYDILMLHISRKTLHEVDL